MYTTKMTFEQKKFAIQKLVQPLNCKLKEYFGYFNVVSYDLETSKKLVVLFKQYDLKFKFIIGIDEEWHTKYLCEK